MPLPTGRLFTPQLARAAATVAEAPIFRPSTTQAISAATAATAPVFRSPGGAQRAMAAVGAPEAGGLTDRIAARLRGKDLDEPTKRLTDAWGGFDEDLYAAQNIQSDLQQALGAHSVDVGLRGAAEPDVERIRALSEAMPGMEAQWRYRRAAPEALELLKTPEQINPGRGGAHAQAAAVMQDLEALRAQGVDIDAEGYRKLLNTRAYMQPGRWLKNVLVGEAPLQLTRERWRRGGLLGPGGVLLGDLTVPTQVRRDLREALDAAREGRYGDAWGKLPLAGLGSYGMNGWFTYGMPAVLTGQALMGEGSTEQRLRRAGSEAFTGLATAPFSPLGLLQMPVADAVQGVAQRFILPRGER